MGAKKLKHYRDWDETHKDGDLDSLGKIEEDGYLKPKVIDIGDEIADDQFEEEMSDDIEEISYEDYLEQQYEKEFDPDYDEDLDEQYIPHKSPRG